MPPTEGQRDLAVWERKVVFRALVTAQDLGMSVAQSRTVIASRYNLSEGQLRLIEDEGTEAGWPPL